MAGRDMSQQSKPLCRELHDLLGAQRVFTAELAGMLRSARRGLALSASR